MTMKNIWNTAWAVMSPWYGGSGEKDAASKRLALSSTSERSKEDSVVPTTPPSKTKTGRPYPTTGNGRHRLGLPKLARWLFLARSGQKTTRGQEPKKRQATGTREPIVPKATSLLFLLDATPRRPRGSGPVWPDPAHLGWTEAWPQILAGSVEAVPLPRFVRSISKKSLPTLPSCTWPCFPWPSSLWAKPASLHASYSC